MIPADETFLSPDEREEIIRLVTYVIDPMKIDGRKNLLLACKLKDRVISRVKLNEDPRNTAESMVRLAETSDKPSPKLRYLREFLHAVIREGGYEETPVETDMTYILSNYDHKRNAQHTRNHLSLRPEEQAIDKAYQTKRNANNTSSSTSVHKIDVSRITKCNLFDQKRKFKGEFLSPHNGFFTFAVASTEYKVLTEYIIESLRCELKRETDNRETLIYHRRIYPEDWGCSNVEQGCLSLQEEIRKILNGKSIRDFFYNRKCNLIIALRFANPVPENFKYIATRFSKALEAQVADILSNCCLVLFWANIGPRHIEPLDIPVVLPPFEQFKIEDVIHWVKTSVREQLEDQHIPEQEIKNYLETLINEIKRHNGDPFETFETLLEPLRSGGIH